MVKTLKNIMNIGRGLPQMGYNPSLHKSPTYNLYHLQLLPEEKNYSLWQSGAMKSQSPEALHLAVYDVGQLGQYSYPASHVYVTRSSNCRSTFGWTLPYRGSVRSGQLFTAKGQHNRWKIEILILIWCKVIMDL